MRALVFAAVLLSSACRERVELGPPEPALVLSGRSLAAPLAVELDTDAGVIHCSLDPERAPHAVALFVGLATGRARWLDPKTRAVTTRPMYRDLPFTRAIPSVFIQSGDPVGDGSGNPGYRIPVETHASDHGRLASPGALVLAPYTLAPHRVDPAPPPPGHVLGSQFALLLTNMSHLTGSVSVLGRCEDLAIARSIAEDVGNRRGTKRLREVRVRQGE